MREENKLQILGKKIRKIFGPTRNEVTEQFRILCNEEACDLYPSTSIVGTMIAQSV
jgi:hypothetical protein